MNILEVKIHEESPGLRKATKFRATPKFRAVDPNAIRLWRPVRIIALSSECTIGMHHQNAFTMHLAGASSLKILVDCPLNILHRTFSIRDSPLSIPEHHWGYPIEDASLKIPHWRCLTGDTPLKIAQWSLSKQLIFVSLFQLNDNGAACQWPTNDNIEHNEDSTLSSTMYHIECRVQTTGCSSGRTEQNGTRTRATWAHCGYISSSIYNELPFMAYRRCGLQTMWPIWLQPVWLQSMGLVWL